MKPRLPAAQRALLRAAIDAALILAIGMGFGRFAYTAVYPLMVDEGGISLQGASLAASANYAGYLLGAVLAVRFKAADAHRLCLLATLGTAATLAALAWRLPLGAIIAVRCLAGIFSAFAIVAASLWLLERRGHFRGAPLLYSGVGCGIALSSELLAAGKRFGLHSAGLWLMLAAATLVLGAIAARGLLSDAPGTAPCGNKAAHLALPPVAAWALAIIYGFAGLGYIVTATYLPLLVKTALPNLDSAQVWAVFGLGAMPSCFVWHRLHEHLRTRHALCLNLLLQALGVALPAISPSTASYVASALLVGGTFMGTVTIAMPAAQHAARRTGRNMLAVMTLIYGVGQIVGPLMAESLRAHSHSFVSSLVAAAGALLIGALLCFRL
jgi:hypothetical protein